MFARNASASILLVLSSFAILNAAPTDADTKSGAYVCPPCPADCHDQTFDKPGECPTCGMTLIKNSDVINVAILVFPGVELLDFAGPGEVFNAAGYHGGATRVYTVAESTRPITSQNFLSIIPEFAVADCPKPDVVVIPGGDTSSVLNSPTTMNWIKDVSKDAKVVLSVCSGAFVLAKVGLLDGLEATTHHGLIDDLKEAAPKTRIHDDRRFVDNGKIVTSAGVSAGIDASLHVVARLFGDAAARDTARYMEYPWNPDAD